MKNQTYVSIAVRNDIEMTRVSGSVQIVFWKKWMPLSLTRIRMILVN